MRYAVAILLIILIAGPAVWFTRSKNSSTPFLLPIDDAFELEAPGQTVVVGVIAEGTVVKGSNAVLRVDGSDFMVVILGIEKGLDNPVRRAEAGDRVGVHIRGVNKSDVSAGASLIGGD